MVIRVTDNELASLGINKGIMHLISEAEQGRILEALEGKPRTYLPGGSAPNTMLALAGLGVEAVISGKLGDDIRADVRGAGCGVWDYESACSRWRGYGVVRDRA